MAGTRSARTPDPPGRSASRPAAGAGGAGGAGGPAGAGAPPASDGHGWHDHRTRTRRRIADAALRLFLHRGFDAVTVAEIAAAAGVGERTVYRYYPTKTDIVLGDQPGELRAFVAALDAAPTDLAPGAAVAHLMRELAPGPELEGADRSRLTLIRSTPTLHRAWRDALDALEPDVRAWVGRRLARDAADPDVGVAAAMLLATHRAIVESWDGASPAAFVATAARAFALVDTGLAELAAAPATA